MYHILHGIVVALENGEEGTGGGEISIDGIVVLLSYLISFALYAAIGLALLWMIATLWAKVRQLSKVRQVPKEDKHENWTRQYFKKD